MTLTSILKKLYLTSEIILYSTVSLLQHLVEKGHSAIKSEVGFKKKVQIKVAYFNLFKSLLGKMSSIKATATATATVSDEKLLTKNYQNSGTSKRTSGTLFLSQEKYTEQHITMTEKEEQIKKLQNQIALVEVRFAWEMEGLVNQVAEQSEAITSLTDANKMLRGELENWKKMLEKFSE